MSSVVIIPTYNERDNLTELTERLLGLGLDLDVVFVDDGSPDGTGKVADHLAQSFPHISVIHRERKLGYGSAVIEGFRAALRGEYSWVLQMDADLSHDPAAIPALCSGRPRTTTWCWGLATSAASGSWIGRSVVFC